MIWLVGVTKTKVARSFAKITAREARLEMSSILSLGCTMHGHATSWGERVLGKCNALG